jgi:3-hydroxybutyryl-CoA dehydrogenase
MNIKTVSVLGAGIMGSGIAQLVAYHGYRVHLVDINEEILSKAKNGIKKNLDRFFVSKSKITTDEADQILDRISLFTNKDDAIKDVEMVIEAIFEDMILKQEIFADLDSKCDKEVILASNTSSLSISDIASSSKNQERIVGIHFFNPAPVMKLIELIKGNKTSNEVFKGAKTFSESLNKTVVSVNDSPGFVTTRLIYVMCNEAIKMKEEGLASKEDIDTAIKLAFNFPMGPLQLSDLVGLDTYKHIGDYLSSELGETYKPSSLLTEMVKKGTLGRKSNEGFYKY